jgi:probable rRNA maturation factor
MRRIQIRQRRGIRHIQIPALRQIIAFVLQRLGVKDYELGIELVGSAEMAKANKQFLGHQGSTDVITFDYAADLQGSASPSAGERRELHGDLLISVDDAALQAREFHTTWSEEIVRYICHGILHLLGYDDLAPAARRIMKREENALMQKLSAEFQLDQIATD